MTQSHRFRHDVDGPPISSYGEIGEVYHCLEELQVRTVFMERQELRLGSYGDARKKFIRIVFALKEKIV